MAVERLRRLRRIGWRLPLSIGALLLAVVATFSWIAYREVRQAALDAARERLEDVARQLASLLQQSTEQRLAETRRAAGDAAVLSLLTGAGGSAAGARVPLERLLDSSEQVVSVEAWDTAGRLVIEVHRPELRDVDPPRAQFPAWAASDTAMLSGFRSTSGAASYEVAAASRQSGRTVGFVVQRRLLSTSPQGARLIADLIGMRAAFVVGGPGRTWTDLTRIVDGPPPAAVADAGAVEYRDASGSWQLGMGMPIGGTPWLVWVAFPRAVVLERAQSFPGRILPIGLTLVILGTAGGWVLSRRFTARLDVLNVAANAMAEGDYARRVAAGRGDELDELAQAFDDMATSLQGVLAENEAAREGAQRVVDALGEREQRLSSIYDTVGDVIFHLTVETDGGYRFTSVNQAFVTITGLTYDQVIGKRVDEIIPEPSLALVLENYAQAIREKTIVRWEETSEYPTGRLTGEVSVAPAFDETGQCTHLVGAVHDITERKRAEQQLQVLAHELERRVADRTAQLQAANEELEAFSYSVSHDLRAPLRGIHGFSQALLEDYGRRLDAQGADYLGRICAATERMAELIDDLLELSRVTRSELQRETVDLSALAERIASELGRHDPQRQIECRVAEGLTADGDPRLLRIVLENLLDNAWKFTAREPRPLVEFGAAELDGQRAFFVRDNGVGFDMAYADKLFGPFQRLHTPSEFPGTGIGLATVQRVVHRHGGRVWAEAAVGRGATFYFAL